MVRTERQRVLEVRGRKGIIHNNSSVALHRRDGRDIRDVRRRVRRRFQPDELRVALDSRAHRLHVGSVDDAELDAPIAVVIVEQAVHAAIRVVAEDDVRARAQDDAQERIHGRHARGEHARVLRVLERGERLLQRAHGRISHASVLEAATQLRQAVLFERRGRVDGHVDRTHMAIRVVSGVDGTGMESARELCTALVVARLSHAGKPRPSCPFFAYLSAFYIHAGVH